MDPLQDAPDPTALTALTVSDQVEVEATALFDHALFVLQVHAKAYELAATDPSVSPTVHANLDRSLAGHLKWMRSLGLVETPSDQPEPSGCVPENDSCPAGSDEGV